MRKLYEFDDSSCLAAFAPLLQDDDSWFRERARRAFDNWCGSAHGDLISDCLADADDDARLLFARLLPRLGKRAGEIADTLATSASIPIRCEVRAFQLSSGSEQERLSTAESILSDPSHIVRRVLARHVTSLDLEAGAFIERLLDDSHPVVITTCLRALNSAGEEKVSAQRLQSLVDSSAADVRLEARLMVIRLAIPTSDFERVARLLPDEELRNERAMIDSLAGSEWHRWKGFIELLEDVGAWRTMALLSTSSNAGVARELQVSLAGNQRVPVDQRLRIIDRLMGRAAALDLAELVSILLGEGDPRLVQAGEQLETMSEA